MAKGMQARRERQRARQARQFDLRRPTAMDGLLGEIRIDSHPPVQDCDHRFVVDHCFKCGTPHPHRKTAS